MNEKNYGYIFVLFWLGISLETKGLIYGVSTKFEVIQGCGRTGFLECFFGNGLKFNDFSYYRTQFSIVSRNAINAEKSKKTISLTNKSKKTKV